MVDVVGTLTALLSYVRTALAEHGFLAVLIFAIGAYKALSWVLGLLYVLTVKRVLPAKLRKYLKKDAWAVVTGCTDGIGREFAVQLAKKGFNVVLLSRTQSKLDEVAKAIEEETSGKAKTLTLAVNFENPDYSAVSATLKKAGGPVTVLINNVGISYDYPEKFLDLEEDRVQALVNLNIKTVNDMTRLVLKGMLEEKCGLVVNIGSASAFIPSPMLAVYGASKQYVSTLTSALAVEYARTGVHFETLEPLYVVSKLSKMRKSFTTPTASAYVRSALGQVGRQSAAHAGFWIHDVALHFLRSAPVDFAMKQVMGMHIGIRKRAIAKKEREAKEGTSEGKTTPRRR